MKLAVLASSSEANALLVGDGETLLLVDCGMSRSKLFRAMAAHGYAPGDISAILITHEHHDHVAGLGKVGRDLQVPVVMSRGTRSSPKVNWPRWATFTVDLKLEFTSKAGAETKSFDIDAFPVPHDAREPAGFLIRRRGKDPWDVGIMLDAGFISEPVAALLRSCRVIVLECNHDKEMLAACAYEWRLKQRIASGLGHLSNDMVAEFLQTIPDTVEHVVLAHLSKCANDPELALMMAEKAVAGKRATVTIANEGESIEF